jgi:hypothetical protein
LWWPFYTKARVEMKGKEKAMVRLILAVIQLIAALLSGSDTDVFVFFDNDIDC